ncbi:MAG TPA: NADH:ubiquinone reductase (Na(+)-transporting) subunit C [Bacteroidetes bacterium]|nr:NADH:ubiquinone reductase (Na(+)-transporting) subunit C [Bacteroidota bacterium]
MYSNGYIFRYAAILVIIAAAALSSANMLLKPYQEKNVAIEKMKGILASAQIEGIETDNTIEEFNKYVVEEKLINSKGEVIDSYKKGNMEDGKAFKINMKEELFNKTQGKDFDLPVYVINKGGKTIYVLPLLGTGLWGPIWGNMALKDDFNTIVGMTFGDKGETPGLGGEITTDQFKNQFIGKKIFDDKGNFTSIKVVKGGIKRLPAAEQIHGVDAISGGTITSNGVDAMLSNVLESYLPYIEKQRKQ